jgi:hypothetical protein
MEKHIQFSGGCVLAQLGDLDQGWKNRQSKPQVETMIGHVFIQAITISLLLQVMQDWNVQRLSSFIIF